MHSWKSGGFDFDSSGAINRPNERATDRPTNRPTERRTDRQISCPTIQAAKIGQQLADQSTNHPANQSIN